MLHTSVLRKEAIDGLHVFKNGKYIDATYGSGGHSAEIIRRGGNVLGIDWSDEIFDNKKTKSQILLIHGNFADIERIANENGFNPCDGILFDFGLSMDQIRFSGRGFSYRAVNEKLDMRINTSIKKTAADIINHSSADELYEIFSNNAEEIHSRAIAERLVYETRIKPVEVVSDLIKIIRSVKQTNEHTIKRIFQALRMEVNSELENIKKAFLGACRIVKKNGRIVFITFHSIEDRKIKMLIKRKQMRELKKVIRSKSDYSFEKTARLRVICV